MASLKRIPRTVEPIDILKDAIVWAKQKSIFVRPGDYGVSCTSTEGDLRWELDDRGEPGVDPIGAAILQHQPPATDLNEAAAQALGESICWVAGLSNGLNLEPKEPRWIASRARDLYLHGYESGTNLRIHVVSQMPRWARKRLG